MIRRQSAPGCRRPAAGPSARRQRSGPIPAGQEEGQDEGYQASRGANQLLRRTNIGGPARTHFSQVNYAMFPKVAGRPKVLSKFSILTGLVRLIFAHPIYAVPLKGSSYAVPLKGSSSYSQVNIAESRLRPKVLSKAKYGAVPQWVLAALSSSFGGGFGAVPPGSGSPFLLFRGGYYKNYVMCRVLFSLAALFFLDPDRTAALGRWSEEIYRSNYLNIKGLPKVLSKNPFLTTPDIAIFPAPQETPSVPAKLPGCMAPLAPSGTKFPVLRSLNYGN